MLILFKLGVATGLTLFFGLTQPAQIAFAADEICFRMFVTSPTKLR